MNAQHGALPVNTALAASAGTPPVFLQAVTLTLPAAGADALAIDAAKCALAGSFGLFDFGAPAAAISAPSSGVFTVTLDSARQVQRVTLNNFPTHRISLLRLDGAKQAPPTVTATQGDPFPAPPNDFTDRRFGLRVDDASGNPVTGFSAGGLAAVTLRSRPARPRLALAVPGQEAAAIPFWTAPAATAPVDTVAITGAAAAFAAALQAFVDGAAPASLLHVSLVAISDAPCKLTLTALTASYRLVRTRFTGAHAGEPKAVLAFPAGAVAPASVALGVPAGAKVISASVATSETLPAALPPAGDWSARAADLDGVRRGLQLAPGLGAAARLTSADGVQATRVALGILVLAAPAELQVQLVADAGGAPSGPPLAEGVISLGAGLGEAGAPPRSGAPVPLAAGSRAWVTVGVGEVPVAAGSACWVVLTASRGAAVWLAGDGAPFTPARGHDGTAVDGLAVLAELLGPPAADAAEDAPQPLALEVGTHAVRVPAATGGTRSFDLTEALRGHRKAGDVELTFRAGGPGTVTVYPPRVEYEVSAG